MGDPKTYRPGETFEIVIDLADSLMAGGFPRAFLRGPAEFDFPLQSELATMPTIVPERTGNRFLRKGSIPESTRPGTYVLHRVDILYSVTGMNDAKLTKSTAGADIKPFSIVVIEPPPQNPNIPPIADVG